MELPLFTAYQMAADTNWNTKSYSKRNFKMWKLQVISLIPGNGRCKSYPKKSTLFSEFQDINH
jgi:hypothetical protein